MRGREGEGQVMKAYNEQLRDLQLMMRYTRTASPKHLLQHFRTMVPPLLLPRRRLLLLCR